MLNRQSFSLSQKGAITPIVTIAIILIVVVLAGVILFRGQTNKPAENTITNSVIAPSQKPVVFQNKILFSEDDYTHSLKTPLDVYDLNSGQTSQLITKDVTLNKQDSTIFSVSPDKQSFAMISSDSKNNFDLQIYSLIEGKNVVTIPISEASDSGVVYEWSGVAWSSDSKNVAFLSGKNGKLNIWTCDAKGNNLEQITSDGSPKVNISWSPDNTKIMYYSLNYEQIGSNGTAYGYGTVNGGDIHVYDLNSKQDLVLKSSDNSIQLFQNIEDDYHRDVVWLDNNNLLIGVPSFSADKLPTVQGLWVFNINTSQAKRIVAKPLSSNMDFYISPDRKSIVFLTEEDGVNINQVNTWFVNSDGTNLKHILSGANSPSVVWSDDNKFIAFAGGFNGKIGVWVSDGNGENLTQVVNKSKTKYTSLSDLIWSNDSSKLLYSDTAFLGEGSTDTVLPKNEADDSGTWVINKDGSNAKKLINFGPPLAWY